MSDPTVNKTLIAGRYLLERRLAQGGMATVHLAQDQVLRRPVALKIMLPPLAQDASFVERFQREAQSAAKLNHPNIVAIYDWGAHEDTYYIAMEYVEGETLAALLRADGSLAVTDATRIAADVADALNCAHRQGIVHRDVKPANVLITPAGEVKVTDFGIARAVENDIDLTEAGKVLGTAVYFSPEQAKGERVGPRSDLYSLGVVLFEMLAGRPPFDAASAVDVAMKHIEEPPPLLSSVDPSIPAGLDTIVGRLLAKDPDDRFASATDVIADLDAGWSGSSTLDVAAVPVDDAPTSLLDSAGAVPTAAMAVPVETGRSPLDDDVEIVDRSTGRSNTFIAAAVILVIAAVALGILLTQVFINESGEAAAGLAAVPSVIGETRAAAESALTDAGFVPDVRSEPSDEIEPGVVFQQDPVGQTQAEEGTSVIIVVSTGGEPAPPATSDDTATTATTAATTELLAVPDVVGADQATAARQLDDLGFNVAIELVDAGTEPVGIVRSQNPAAAEQAPVGATITLQVAEAPEAGSTTSSLPSTTTTAATSSATTQPSTTASTATTTSAPAEASSTESGSGQ